jgi:hypothetical protein
MSKKSEQLIKRKIQQLQARIDATEFEGRKEFHQRKQTRLKTRETWPKCDQNKRLGAMLLQFILRSKNGRRYSELLEYLAKIEGLDRKECYEDGRCRWYHSHWLLQRHQGDDLLNRFCVKVDGRWCINSLKSRTHWATVDGSDTYGICLIKENN